MRTPVPRPTEVSSAKAPNLQVVFGGRNLYKTCHKLTLVLKVNCNFNRVPKKLDNKFHK